jgi:hypothetical protein
MDGWESFIMVNINQYTMKPYTKKEIKFIINKKGTFSNKEIAEKLNRDTRTIKDKIKNMRISRSPEQTSYIINKCRANRKYLKYAAENPSWRKMITLPNKKRILESHHVWSKHNNQEVPKKHVIHHKDLNPKNNKIENLDLMSKAKHNRLHTSNEGIYGLIKKERNV